MKDLGTIRTMVLSANNGTSIAGILILTALMSLSLIAIDNANELYASEKKMIPDVNRQNQEKVLNKELSDIEREIDILTSGPVERSRFGLEGLTRDLTEFTEEVFKEFKL